MPPFERPPPQFPGGFKDWDVLPELEGKTLVEIAGKGLPIKVWCRACGRDVILPPMALRETAERNHHLMTIEQFVRISKCRTCGAYEAQASSWELSFGSDGPAIVRYEYHGGPFMPYKKAR